MKNKKLILILSVLAIIVIVIVVAAIATLYFTTDIFKSDDQLFAKYLLQDNNIEEILQLDMANIQKGFMKNNSYTSNGTLLLEIQKEGQAVQGAQINTNSKYDVNTKRSYSEMTLKDGEIDLLNVSYINSDNVYGIKCDSIYGNYIGFRNSDLKRFARAMGLTEEMIDQIPDTIPMEVTQDTEIISKEDWNYLIDTYTPIIVESIPKEKYGKAEKTNITIEEQEYQAEGYTLTLNEEDIRKILVNVLTKANEDLVTIKILHTILEKMEVPQEQIPELTLNILSKMLQTIQTTDIETTNLEIIVYQANGRNIRTQIKVNDVTIFIDVAKEETDNKRVIISAQIEENTILQVAVEKQITTDAAMQRIEILTYNSNQVPYKVTTNTTLGAIVNNSFRNASELNIQDYDGNNINISYNKTIQLTTENIEIQELKDSDTVIVNNYPKEQLEPFFESIANKCEETFENIAAQLNINIVSPTDSMQYVQSVVGAILVIANVNGVEPIIGVTGASIMAVANQIFYSQVEIIDDFTTNVSQQEQQIYNAQFISYEGIQSGATVKSLCNTVAMNNMMLSEEETPITMIRFFDKKEIASENTQNIKAVSMEEINNLKEQIETGKNYNIELGYDLAGTRIVTIVIYDV